MPKYTPPSSSHLLRRSIGAAVAGFALAATSTSVRAADVYWNNTSTNWDTSTSTWNTASDNSGTTQVWNNGDNAIFSTSNIAAGQYSLTVGTVTAGNMTVNSTQRIQLNAGTITLNSGVNTYTVARTSGDYDLRINSVIAGTGSIVKEGAGMLMLTGANTFSGGVTLNNGTLNFESSSTAFGTGTLTLNGGNFAKTWGTTTTLANAVNVTGTTNVGIVQGSPSDIILSGAFTGSGNFSVGNTSIDGFAIQNASVKIIGDISGYTGTFSQNTLASGGNRLRFGPTTAGSTTINGSQAKFFTSGSTAGNAPIDMGDNVFGTFKMGELAGTGGAVRGGWGQNTGSGNTTFEVGALNTASKYAGQLQDNLGAVAGQSLLNKVGTGTLELSLAAGNTYTGGTTVTGGRLLVSNTSGSGTGAGAVTVASGGVFGGTGIILPTGSNGITVSGTLAPGGSVSATTGGSFNDSVGTLTFNLGSTTGVVTMSSGSNFTFDLGAGVTASKISITSGTAGDLVFNGNTVNFNNISGGTLANGSYTLFTADAAVYSGLTVDGSNFITSGLSIGSGLSGYTANLQLSGNNIVLNLVAVPEPNQAALCVIGLLGLMVCIRRRRQMNQ